MTTSKWFNTKCFYMRIASSHQINKLRGENMALSFAVDAKPGDLVGDAIVVEFKTDLSQLTDTERGVLTPLIGASRLMGEAYAWLASPIGAPTLAFLEAAAPNVPDVDLEWFRRFSNLVRYHSGQYDQANRKVLPEKPISGLKLPDGEVASRMVEILGVPPAQALDWLMKVADFVDDPNLQMEKPALGGFLINSTGLPQETIEAIVRKLLPQEEAHLKASEVNYFMGRTLLHPRSLLEVSLGKTDFTGGRGLDVGLRFAAVPYIDHPIIGALYRQAIELIGKARKVKGIEPGLAEYLWALQHDLAFDGHAIASDRAILDNKSRVQAAIRDVESYTDHCTGVRQDPDGIVSIVREKETGILRELQGRVLELEDRIPVDKKYKHQTTPQAGQILISDVVFMAGPSASSVMTLAHALPNPPEIQAVGTVKNMFFNAIRAKYEHILLPIIDAVCDPEFAARFGHTSEAFWDAFLMFIIGHEVCHGFIEQEGLREKFGKNFHNIEEAKADLGSMYSFSKFHEWNYISATTLDAAPNVFVAGLIRSIRMAPNDAHSIANNLQLNFLMELGGVELRENGIYRPTETFLPAVEHALQELCEIEGEKNHARGLAIAEKYGRTSPSTYATIERLSKIPRDIVPVFSLN
jgi:hypothetical protein